MEFSDFAWEEVIPNSGMQTTPIGVTADSMSAQMDIWVAWADIRKAIKYIIGCGTVTGGPPPQFWRLSRQVPASHPRFKWMRATRIISIVGFPDARVAPMRRVNVGAADFARWTGDFARAKISILFEAPRYPILSDGLTIAEYQRNVTYTYETNVETLARRGQTWNFVNAAARAVTPSGQYPGELLLKQPKGVLQLTWHDVPEAYVMLGRLIPSNFRAATGKVNLQAFPQAGGFINQNTGAPVQFGAGTLLMMPAKLEPRTQVHPNIVSTVLPQGTIPRTYDIKMSMIEFDPPTDDTTTVVTPIGPVVVRGHNLVPLPQPVPATGYRWYTATFGTPFTSPLPNDSGLLYQYYDFEKLFLAAQNL